jgi:hypothetical protein
MYGRADAGNEQRKRAVRVNCKITAGACPWISLDLDPSQTRTRGYHSGKSHSVHCLGAVFDSAAQQSFLGLYTRAVINILCTNEFQCV